MHCLRIAAALNMVSVGRLPSIDRSNAFLVPAHQTGGVLYSTHTDTRDHGSVGSRMCEFRTALTNKRIGRELSALHEQHLHIGVHVLRRQEQGLLCSEETDGGRQLSSILDG